MKVGRARRERDGMRPAVRFLPPSLVILLVLAVSFSTAHGQEAVFERRRVPAGSRSGDSVSCRSVHLSLPPPHRQSHPTNMET